MIDQSRKQSTLISSNFTYKGNSMLSKIEPTNAVQAMQCIFFEQGFIDSLNDEISADASLRDVYDCDSQDMVTIACAVNELCIGAEELYEGDLVTAGDITEYVESHLNHWLPKDTDIIMQSSIEIRQPIDTVFRYIADYQSWPEHLAHVTKVNPLSQDGTFEKFRMHIKELTNGEEYSVDSQRSVNREAKEIEFDQLRPPNGFKVHKGGWRFRELAPDRTELISFHGFTLYDSEHAADACTLIRKHIRAALSTWADVGNK